MKNTLARIKRYYAGPDAQGGHICHLPQERGWWLCPECNQEWGVGIPGPGSPVHGTIRPAWKRER